MRGSGSDQVLEPIESCGIVMVSMFGGPIWFTVLDLLGAYLPMGYLGGMLAGAKKPQSA